MILLPWPQRGWSPRWGLEPVGIPYYRLTMDYHETDIEGSLDRRLVVYLDREGEVVISDFDLHSPYFLTEKGARQLRDWLLARFPLEEG